jgi:hypothetical protein
VATTAPQTYSLITVDRDMTEVLAVVALHKASPSSVLLSLDYNMVKAIRLEYPLRCYISCLCNWK